MQRRFASACPIAGAPSSSILRKPYMLSCRTKELYWLCLKYLGRTAAVNTGRREYTSSVASSAPHVTQEPASESMLFSDLRKGLMAALSAAASAAGAGSSSTTRGAGGRRRRPAETPPPDAADAGAPGAEPAAPPEEAGGSTPDAKSSTGEALVAMSPEGREERERRSVPCGRSEVEPPAEDILC